MISGYILQIQEEAIGVHHDLAEYLYTAHRLILEPRKTRPIRSAIFVTEELQDPEELEKTAQAQKVKEMLAKVLAESGYQIGEDDLLAEDKDQLVRNNSEAIRRCISKGHSTWGWHDICSAVQHGYGLSS